MERQQRSYNLHGRNIFFALPAYDHKVTLKAAISLARFAQIAPQHGIDFAIGSICGCSVVSKARNMLADEFLQTQCTDLMFIDSDIGFDPNDVLTLAALMDHEDPDGKHIMCGPYPKKTIAWEKVKRAVDRGFADDDPSVLERFVGDYVFNPADGQTEVRIDEPVKVLEGGTGFMMVTKDAFNKFAEAYPDYSYLPDHVRTKHFDGSREIMMYFQALIDEKTKRYLSEDYMFCQWMQKVGVDTWMCPWMKLLHTGSYTFGGSLADLAAVGATATADHEQIKKMKK